MLLIRIVRHTFIIKIQIVNYDFRGFVAECGRLPFHTVPNYANTLLEGFIEDGFFLFDSKTKKAFSLDRSHMAFLPNVEPFSNLEEAIFDASTISL